MGIRCSESCLRRIVALQNCLTKQIMCIGDFLKEVFKDALYMNIRRCYKSMNIENHKQRIFAVDFCCVIGLVLMLGFHFFSRSGFESNFALSGFTSICILALRWLCMAGLPLIYLINGAAFSRTSFSFSQYKGYIKLAYCFVLSYFLVNYITKGSEVASGMAGDFPFYYFSTSDFAISYAMLLLASPFLNCTYQALPSNKAKFSLIAILALLTSLPDMLIIDDVRILPDNLQLLYPVTLYFLGAYIYENRKSVDSARYFVLLLTLSVAQAIFSYSDSQGSGLASFSCKRLDSYSSLAVIASAASIFAMFCKINPKPKFLHKIFKYLARTALPIILLCGFFENKVAIELIGGDLGGINFPYIKYFLPYWGIIILVMFAVGAVILLPFDIIRAVISLNSDADDSTSSEAETDENKFPTETEDTTEPKYYNSHYNEKGNDETVYIGEKGLQEAIQQSTHGKYEAQELSTPDNSSDYATQYDPNESHYSETPISKEKTIHHEKVRTAPTLDSILSEVNADYHSIPSHADVDDLVKFIKSEKNS